MVLETFNRSFWLRTWNKSCIKFSALHGRSQFSVSTVYSYSFSPIPAPPSLLFLLLLFLLLLGLRLRHRLPLSINTKTTIRKKSKTSRRTYRFLDKLGFWPFGHHRKSVRKFRFYKLVLTCESVWPGLSKDWLDWTGIWREHCNATNLSFLPHDPQCYSQRFHCLL